MTSTAPPPRTLSLRGRSLRAVVLAPEVPLDAWLDRLDGALGRSPTLLDGKAVILDVGALDAASDALDALVSDLAGRNVRILALQGTQTALGSLPLLPAGRATGLVEVPAEPEPEPEAPAMTSLTIEGSVRSGQTIVHPDGDVTVMGSVSSGAEILAGGSIHVYGALRGRAIAGAARNPRARIYCRKFEPELLGIDRLVRSAEDMGTHLRGQPVQIWLDGGAIKIAALG